jgi:hypothetical protein
VRGQVVENGQVVSEPEPAVANAANAEPPIIGARTPALRAPNRVVANHGVLSR